MNVTIAVPSTMNNFGILPQGVDILGKKVFFHNDPRMSIVDGETRFNFDYIITDGNVKIDGTFDAHDIVPAERVRLIKRFDKQTQTVRLNNFANEQQRKTKGAVPAYKDFVRLSTWFNTQPHSKMQLVDPDSMVIVKPRDGARGIGQFLIDPTIIPFVVFTEKLARYRGDKITGEELLNDLRKIDPNLKYSTAGENYENEGLLCLKLQDFMIQSYVPNIKAEYRIITNGRGDVGYCQKRDIRKDSAFPQATGSDTNSILADDVIPIKEVLSATQVKELNLMMREVVGPMSSADLFVTEDGRWGIFEYCNQFGIVGVPMKIARDLHKDFIAELISSEVKTSRSAQELFKLAYSPVNGEKYEEVQSIGEIRERLEGYAWMYNPWTGEPRDLRDIGSDPYGLLIVPA